MLGNTQTDNIHVHDYTIHYLKSTVPSVIENLFFFKEIHTIVSPWKWTTQQYLTIYHTRNATVNHAPYVLSYLFMFYYFVIFSVFIPLHVSCVNLFSSILNCIKTDKCWLWFVVVIRDDSFMLF